MDEYTQKIELEPIPDEVLGLLRKFHENGFEAYLVGGTVRDLLAGLPVADYDIATNATPDETTSLFKRTVPTGIKHGTITVLGNEGHYEVTTYRCDGKYGDARHPDEIQFADDLIEDLMRRDLTINAMAYDPIYHGLVDKFGGVKDFAEKTVRAVGDPNQRFFEDGLRPLRAIRLAARFDFAFDPDTFAAISGVLDRVEMVSAERVRDELMKMLATAEKPSYGFELMRQSGLLDIILPELIEGYGVEQNKFHAYTVYLHSIYCCDYAPKEQPLIRLAALFHDIAKPRTKRIKNGSATFYNHQVVAVRMSKNIMKRLRFSRKEINYVSHLVYHHMFGYTEEWTDAAVRRFIRKVGRDYIEDLFELRLADWFGNGRNRGYPKYLNRLRERIRTELEKADAFDVKDLDINGDDVMKELDIKPGPQVGEALDYLLQRVLDDPGLNRKDKLIELLEEFSAKKVS
ncbi:MAG: HD domain-containing protein [bacterium]|nr:HD domain-containing protein [bacterium]